MTLRKKLILLTPAAGLLAALVARLLAGRVLRPVGALTAAVEHITSTRDLATRVAVGGRDEVSRLATAFSAMTVALDGSVGAQRRLVADASHELRTPRTYGWTSWPPRSPNAGAWPSPQRIRWWCTGIRTPWTGPSRTSSTTR
ncbi:HAMP domain-containing protein [Kitasatospora sp. P5_F3]